MDIQKIEMCVLNPSAGFFFTYLLVIHYFRRNFNDKFVHFGFVSMSIAAKTRDRNLFLISF